MSDFYVNYSSQTLQNCYEVGLVITCYNRPYYLHRTLASLQRSQLTNTILLIVDDTSNSYHTHFLLRYLNFGHTPCIVAYRKEKKDCLMFENLKWGWSFLSDKFNCKYFVNLDSDVLVTQHWLITLKHLFEQQKTHYEHLLLTGFNAVQHSVIREEKAHYYKKSLGGINLFFDELLYRKLIEPLLTDLQWDNHLVEAMNTSGYPIICTKPSVVQHIGRMGLWSGLRSGTYDYAVDFRNTNGLLMKFRTWWFAYSKQLLQYSSNKLFQLKVIIELLFYRLIFRGLYSKKRKNDVGD